MRTGSVCLPLYLSNNKYLYLSNLTIYVLLSKTTSYFSHISCIQKLESHTDQKQFVFSKVQRFLWGVEDRHLQGTEF